MPSRELQPPCELQLVVRFDEAEGMAGRIDIHPKGRRFRSCSHSTKRENSLLRTIQIIHLHVKVNLLRHMLPRPLRCGEIFDLLEGKQRAGVIRPEDLCPTGFVREFSHPQQLGIKICERICIRAVENNAIKRSDHENSVGRRQPQVTRPR